MTTDQNNGSNNNKKNQVLTVGAAALISVLAVPVSLIAGILLSGKKRH